jgi:hypothetical protein
MSKVSIPEKFRGILQVHKRWRRLPITIFFIRLGVYDLFPYVQPYDPHYKKQAVLFLGGLREVPYLRISENN